MFSYKMPACLLLCALAAPSAHADMPDLPSAGVHLSWSDFKVILEGLATADPSKTPEDPPPVPWAVQGLVCEVDATDPAAVRIDARIRLQVWAPRWALVPLFDWDTAVESVALNGETTYLVEMDGRAVMPVEAPGLYEVTATYFTRAQSARGEVRLPVPVPTGAAARIRLHIADAEALVTAPAAASLDTRPHEDGGLTATLLFPPQAVAEIRWQRPTSEPDPAAEPPVASRAAAESATFAVFTEHGLRLQTRLEVVILQGERQHFSLRFPEDAEVLSIQGEGLDWSSESVEDGRKVSVKLNHAVDERYGLHIEWEYPLPDRQGTVTMPTFGIDETIRHTGYLAVASEGNIELHTGDAFDHVRRIDARDLPEMQFARVPAPVLHAFRFAEPRFMLPIGFEQLAEVPVRGAHIDRARITTVLTQEGVLVQHVRYDVRNNHRNHLRVHVGEGAEIWTARTNGEAVRPASDDVEHSVLLPLRNSDTAAHQGNAFPVELIYQLPPTQHDSWRQVIALSAPRADIPANELQWEVFLPEQYRLARASGDVRPLEGSSLSFDFTRGGSGPTDEESLMRLREGIERFLITDINGPAMSAQMGRRAYSQQQAPASDRPAPAVQIAGILPLDLDLPRTGRAYHFSRSIVPAEESVGLVLETVDRRIVGAAQWLATGLALLLGAGLAGWLLRRPRRKPLGGSALAILFAVSAGAWLAPQVGGPELRNIVLAAWLGAGLCLAAAVYPTLQQRLLERRPRTKATASTGEA